MSTIILLEEESCPASFKSGLSVSKFFVSFELFSHVTLTLTVGILYAYTIGPFVSYIMFQYLCLLIPVIFIVTFILMPDTPHYYLSKGSRQRAINSLRYLRGKSAEGVAEELDEIQASVLESMSHRAVFTDVFKGRANLIGKKI